MPHAIIIDDIREFVGDHGYPTKAELLEHLTRGGYVTTFSNDMLQAISAPTSALLLGSRGR
jgi:hypothetical protein